MIISVTTERYKFSTTNGLSQHHRKGRTNPERQSAGRQHFVRSRQIFVGTKRVKVKVKCTLVQALMLCTGRSAHRGSRVIALLFHDHGTRRGWGVSVTPWLLFTTGKDPVLIVQEAGWALGPVWTGAENLVPTGIRSPDRPARSQSLYRLRYPRSLEIVPCPPTRV